MRRKPSKSRGPFFVLLFGLLLAARVANGRPIEVLAGFADDEGTKYAALAIHSDEPATPPFAVDLALVIDLTASQGGASRAHTVQLATDLIEGLQGGSRVQVWLAGQRGKTMLARPMAVGSPEIGDLCRKLEVSVPLGASDLPGVIASIRKWLSNTSGSLPKVILSIGDGQSTLQPLTAAEIDRIAAELIEAQVPWSAVTVGTRLPNPCSTLALRTGGRVWGGSRGVPEIEALLGAICRFPVVLEKIQTIGGIEIVLPASLATLRSDQKVLLLAKLQPAGPHALKFYGSARGEVVTQSLELPSFESRDENAFLRVLYDRWQRDPQSTYLGEAADVLALLRRQLDYRFEQLISDAERRLILRDSASAETLYRQASEIAPNDPQVELGRRAVARLKQASEFEAAASHPSGSEPSPKEQSTKRKTTRPVTDVASDPVEDVKAKESIEAQRLHRMVRDAVSQAQKLSRSDYQAALQQLKQTLSLLDNYPGSSAARHLRRRVEQELRTVWRHGQRQRLEQVERDRALAGFEARDRRAEGELTKQQQTQMLINRYRSLWQQGNFADAEAAAQRVALQDPASIAASAAQKSARLADHHHQANEIEVVKQEGWWRALAAVEHAAVPFPDSTPLVYPPARFWEEISVKRERYSAVDLAPISPAEEAVRRSLTRPVSFDFVDAPLSDVVDFLREYTGVNVVLDTAALEEVGIDLDMPVTLSLRAVSLRSALKLLLRPLELTYLVTDEVLLLTSYQVAENNLITKVYPVGDLVIPIGSFTSGGVGTVGGPSGNQGGEIGQGPVAGGPAFGSGNGGSGAPNAARGDRLSDRPPRTPGEKPAEKLQRVVEEAAGDWEAFFEQRPLEEATLRRLLAEFTEQRDHNQASQMLQALMRHHATPPWIHEALSLSLRLAEADPQEIQESLLSLVDLAPASLELRRRLAGELAMLGQLEAALELLESAIAIEPRSVRTHLQLLELAAAADDMDRLAVAANALLSSDWPRRNELIHAQARGHLRRVEERCRRRGDQTQAERCAAIAALVPQTDLEIVVSWHGETDVDLAVVEPGDLLCSAALPLTVQGGVLISDEHPNSERYIAHRAFAGTYEILLRAHWGAPTADTVYVDVVKRGGTEKEIRQRHSVRMDQGNGKLTVALQEGRREEVGPIGPIDEMIVQDASDSASPKTQLHQMLGGVFSSEAQPEAFEQPITASGPLAQMVPFVTGGQAVASGGAVAFDPVITFINNGPSLTAQAVVSSDRRYVRMTLIPVLQNVQAADQVRSIPITGVAR